MIDRFIISIRSKAVTLRVAFAIPVVHLLTGGSVFAQAPSAASYAADPSAEAGMTTGVPTAINPGMTNRQAEMIQVRTSAQGAMGEATAASMSRTADRSIEERNRVKAIESAREVKLMKREMANRMKWERAATAYNKVSSNDMSTWKTSTGNVKVERNVPDAFLTAIIAEEEREAAAASEQKRGLFGRKKSSEGGMLSNISLPNIPVPRLPFVGGGRDNGDSQESAPVSEAGNEPSFSQSNTAPAPRSQPQPQQVSTAPTKPGTIPRISGAALVDGYSPVNKSEAPTAADTPPSQPSEVSFSSSLPDTEEEKTGFFSRLRGGGNSSASSSRGGGLFSFGGKKKESETTVGTIDASLFPAGAVQSTPTGNLGGGYTAADVARDAEAAPSSTGSIELPGQTMEKERSGFSLPKPNLSIPKITKAATGGSPGIPTTTTVNSSGNSMYVVTSTAQFMVYGADRMQSEVRALPAGTVVQMLKPGEQWASVLAQGGAEGVIQTKNLRPASSNEVGGQFAPSGN
ncbi:MAG: hypothetical protein P1U86_06755 [Verrucomicrobiales bacterium]|nr:hypothetical protein [Verrucomicrobiales bacterium]